MEDNIVAGASVATVYVCNTFHSSSTEIKVIRRYFTQTTLIDN